MNKKILTLLFLPLLLGYNKVYADNVDQMFPNLVMSKFHYEKTQVEVAKPGTNRLKMIYVQEIRNSANVALTSTPNPIVSLKNNPSNVNVANEMAKIYKLCIAYLFSQDQNYLNKAVEHLSAWAKINTAERKYNIHESVYNQGVEGYSIIRNVVDENSRTLIDNWLKKRANIFVSDNDLRENNWGTCLLYQIYTSGLVLNEPQYINWFKTKYPAWVKTNLFPNGAGTDILGRDAFAYHTYNLSFFGDICHAIAMYEGYESADEFYARDINWGASIKKSVHFWIPFMMDPEKNTHIEFTNTEWSPDKNRADANKPYDPLGTLYVLDKVFEMDYELKSAIDKYRAGNIFGTWPLTLGGVRWEFGDSE